MAGHVSYIREKLRGAVATLRDEASDRSLQERLRDAYAYNLSSLEAKWFPDVDAQDDFRAIDAALNRYGEMLEGAGSMPTTVFTMSDADAQDVADRIFKLADRYLA
jgi:hypothetical protein